MNEDRAARKSTILAIACLGQFMVILDVAIVTVALPAMRADLGFSATGLQWVVNAYTLTFAGFLLLGGRAADLFGRRRIFIAGLALFTAASLVCGLAPGPETLVAARAVQGLGAAVLSPATLTILTTTFTEPRERARALGIWSAALASGGATGALLGGILTDTLSWRWIFLVNVPVGVAGIVAARAVLAERRGEGTRSLDLAGALLVTGSLTALVYGLVRTDVVGWGSPQTAAALVISAVLMAAFLVVETRVAASPLVPLGLLRRPSLAGANLAMLCVGGSMFAMWYFASLYLQGVLGESPLRAGLAFLPASLAVIAGAQAGARLVPRLGPRRLLVVAPLVIAAGLVWMSQVSADGSYATDILGPIVVAAFGLGLSFPPGTYAATSGVAPRDAGLASGLVNATRQVGGAVGLALLATIAVHQTAGALAGGDTAAQAIVSGYGRAFLVGAGIAVAASLSALLIPGAQRERAEAAPSASADG
ncbi:MAG: MFS transporter [Thermoleophilia bacterium]